MLDPVGTSGRRALTNGNDFRERDTVTFAADNRVPAARGGRSMGRLPVLSSLHAESLVARDTLGGDPGQVCQCRPDVAGGRGVACGHGELARSAVHRSAGRAHRFGHERSHGMGTVPFHRAHPEALLGNLRGLFEFIAGQRFLDLLQRKQVVAHVGEHMHPEFVGKLDQRPQVLWGIRSSVVHGSRASMLHVRVHMVFGLRKGR
jgi:hypothetical protein